MGPLVLFPLTMFQFFPMGHLPIINTQSSNMQGEPWIVIASSPHKLYFAGFLGRPSFLKQQYKQMRPQPLQSRPFVCGFYTIYAAFHVFSFRQEIFTGVHDVNVPSLLSNYMQLDSRCYNNGKYDTMLDLALRKYELNFR